MECRPDRLLPGRGGTIPETVTTVLALVLGNGHRLLEAVEGGLGIGLRALMAGMMVDLRVQGFGLLVVHDASSLDSADIEDERTTSFGMG